jgi:quercetin dioxygenase-like cupin family protein
MVNRRTVLESFIASLATSRAMAQGVVERAQVIPVFHQELPELDLKNWAISAVEVHYGPGLSSPVHRHPGFVLGYVLEGAVRFALKGQAERIVNTGQMFYEPPGSIHQVSSNASKEKPARLLALIFAERGEPLTKPA